MTFELTNIVFLYIFFFYEFLLFYTSSTNYEKHAIRQTNNFKRNHFIRLATITFQQSFKSFNQIQYRIQYRTQATLLILKVKVNYVCTSLDFLTVEFFDKPERSTVTDR